MKIGFTCCFQRDLKLKNKNRWTPLIIAIVLSLVVFGVDIGTKYYFDGFLGSEPLPFIPGFIRFIKVHNTGAGYGIFEGKTIFLILLTALLIGIFITCYVLKFVKSKTQISKTLSVAFGFIVGGSLGNLFDRIFLGYVRDFIDFDFMSFPVFNLADVALCVGIVILIVYFLFIMPKEKPKEEK